MAGTGTGVKLWDVPGAQERASLPGHRSGACYAASDGGSGPLVAAGRATGIGADGVVVLRAAGLTGTAGLLASARAREGTMGATTIARAPSTPYARGCRRMPAGTQRPPRAKPCSLHVA